MNFAIIQTSYKGYLFRSRIEARWAVFFDALNIKWEYEKEGYNLDGIYYLPDFWLPEFDCWIEIKGTKPTNEEMHKTNLLAQATNKNVYTFFGNIPAGEFSDNSSAYVDFAGGEGWDLGYLWTQCIDCGKLGIQFDGRSARINCCEANKNNKSDKIYNSDAPQIIQALNKAKSWRFD